MTGNLPAPLDFGSLRFVDLDVHALARELLDSDSVASMAGAHERSRKARP